MEFMVHEEMQSLRNGNSYYCNVNESMLFEGLYRVECKSGESQNQDLCRDMWPMLQTIGDQVRKNMDKCSQYLCVRITYPVAGKASTKCPLQINITAEQGVSDMFSVGQCDIKTGKPSQQLLTSNQPDMLGNHSRTLSQCMPCFHFDPKVESNGPEEILLLWKEILQL